MAAILDNICEKAVSIEAEKTLHSRVGSLSVESGEVVEVGKAGESPLRELLTSLSEIVARLCQQVTNIDTRLAELEQMQTTEDSMQTTEDSTQLYKITHPQLYIITHPQPSIHACHLSDLV